ncbi:MAG: protein kinase domain-containing protein [Bdellovibrio bacteriovorus]
MELDQAQLPQIPGYTTQSVLGAGGMATVYLAVQESLSRNVALKVMNPLLMIDADYGRRFLNEGRLIARLSHPNIVTVYDIGASERFHYLSMTYLPGGTLRDKIRTGLPLEYALSIIKCLAQALGYAHRQGIVHRDIKPSNVLFAESGAPVLTDFGIAKTVGSETKLTSTGMTVGSVGYMSPEQALGEEVDSRSDLYSLGVLLWQMLTGSMPYSASDPFALALKHAKDPIPRLPSPLGRFQPAIERLMAKRPQDRLGSAEALVELMDAIPFKDIATHSTRDADETIVVHRTSNESPERLDPGSEPRSAHPSAPRRRIGRAAALVGSAALAVVAASVGYRNLSSPSGETVAEHPAAASAPDARAPSAGSAVPAQTGDGPRIEELLRQAEVQWKAGRLTEPPGDNAFEKYSLVLELDPEQPKAKERLVEIGRINAAYRVFRAAESSLRQGEIDDARRLIETGLKMNPYDDRLLGLQRALDYKQ